MKLQNLAAVGATALLTAIVPTTASATADVEVLNTYKDAPPSQTGFAGPEVTDSVLKNGKQYVVQVTGTYSNWDSYGWTSPPNNESVCGTPDRFPMIPSPGRPLGRVGADAETTFARIDILPGCAGPFEPIGPNPKFQIDLGSGYSHPVAVGAPYQTPNFLHSYTYIVTGQGQKASFRLIDANTQDNYGQLLITVLPKLF